MTELEQPINTIVGMIDKHHEDKQEPPRYHFGLSQCGHDCDRWLWLSFRWSVIERFEGRMLRLFRRGHNEEHTIVHDLRAIGLEIENAGEYNQYRVNLGSHVSGSLDGIIKSGVPDAPNKKHILEAKTHNLKSFQDLIRKGVEESKPMHYAQMQVYMESSGIDRALYVAVCKNDDRMYTERVKLKKKEAKFFKEKYIGRAKRIAMSERIPEPFKTDSTWYQCKMCAAHDFCYGSKTTKEVNCRTCARATPKEDNTFFCERWQSTIPNNQQLKGCPSHVLHPDLVPWQLKEGKDENTATYLIEGKEVCNGENGLKSSEIIANPKACAKEDSFT